MSYKVIHFFTDLQDFNHAYRVGDIFPRTGVKVSDSRIAELASNKNKQGKPLIQKVEEETKKADDFSQHMTPPEEVAEVSYTKTEINRMTTAKLRETAKGEGIADAEELTGGELKKLLIEHYGL